MFNTGFVILSVLKPEYQSLYAKYETPKLMMAEGIISIIEYPFKKSISIFPNTEPKAPYGPNNNPKTYNNPTWGANIPKSKNISEENIIWNNIIIINDIIIFLSLDFIISRF